MITMKMFAQLVAVAALTSTVASSGNACCGAAAGQAGGAVGNGGYAGGDGTGMAESGLGGGNDSGWNSYAALAGYGFVGMAANSNYPGMSYMTNTPGGVGYMVGPHPGPAANDNGIKNPPPGHGPGPGRSYSSHYGAQLDYYAQNPIQGFGGGHFTSYDPTYDPFMGSYDFMNLGVQYAPNYSYNEFSYNPGYGGFGGYGGMEEGRGGD